MRAVDMVDDAGYTPVEAVDAEEAVAILESRSDIALLLTDIQMPGSMDGLKLGNIEIPTDSRFFGKPLEAQEMIAEMQSMIGHA